MTDPAEKTTPIARNVLSMSDLIRLTDWARANREQCETLSNKTLATMAGETLSLYLTAANIASALEAVSITKVKPKAPPTLEERVTKLEFDTDAYLAAYGARINALERNVRQLIDIVQTLERSQLPTTMSHMKSHMNGPGLTGAEDAAIYLNPDKTEIIHPANGRYIIGVDPAKKDDPLAPGFRHIGLSTAQAESLRQGNSDPDLLLVEHHNIIHGTDTDVKPHSETPSLPVP